MKNLSINHLSRKSNLFVGFVFLFVISFTIPGYTQSVTVLPNNGAFVPYIAPQGAFNYQRAFYLITPKEMLQSGFQSGMSVDAIGFTIGVPQSDSSRGAFRVYLENTPDTVCRRDSNYTVLSAAGNSITLNGLIPGDYEWEVISDCSPAAVDTLRAIFSNNSLTDCNPPTHLVADNITSNSVALSWVSPASLNITEFIVQYKSSDSLNWEVDSVTGNTVNLAGLPSGKNFQWRVRTLCSAGNSDFSYSSFLTEAATAACNPPGSLAVGTIGDTTVNVSWSSAAGANYYSIRYRRSGTSTWSNKLSFTTASSLAGLKPGTTYEWGVRTICPAGNGPFIAGPGFTTTGITSCYSPQTSFTDSLTDSTAVLSWSATGAATYTIRYRLKNFIEWSNAYTSMVLVHDDTIAIPATTGPYDIAFANGNPFTYTGGGLYVAFEFARENGTAPEKNISLCTTENSVIKGVNGEDSLLVILSMGANDDQQLPGKLAASNLRPETRLGSPGLKDSVEVTGVYALGNAAIPFSSPQSISARIINHTSQPQTLSVILTVKDQLSNAVRFTDTQTINIAADTSLSVLFAPWSPTLLETDSIIVSIPAIAGENVLSNNRSYYLQNVKPYVVSYADESSVLTGTGFGTQSGLILSRYTMNGCGKVNSAQIYLTASAVNHTLRAVLLDGSGAIIDSSDNLTPDLNQVNLYHSFYFRSLPTLTNEDYYVGLNQTADPAAYYPVGIQWEGTEVRDSAYYRAKPDGDSLTNTPQPGRLMIRAGLIPAVADISISGPAFLCPGNTNTLQALEMSRRFANEVLDFSSQASSGQYSAQQALGTPDVYPAYTTSPLQWISSSADDQREYLVLGFPNTGRVNYIDMYETFNTGAIDTVSIKDTAGVFVPVYAQSAVAGPPAARIKRITFSSPTYNVSEVRIALNSPAIPGYNAIDAVAIGYIDSANAAGSSFLWSPGGETTSSISVTTTGLRSVTVNSAGSCPRTASVNVTPHVAIVPVITANRPTSLCIGDSVLILSSSVPYGNQWSTGDTTQSITIGTSQHLAQSYRVWYDDGSGCLPDTSLPISVTVGLPAFSITGNLQVCPGQSTILGLSTSFDQYNWSTGSTDSTTTVNGGGTYSVVVTSGGCSESKSVSVSQFTPPQPVISGNLFFCPGGSTTLDAGTGYSSYSWSSGESSQSIISSAVNFYSVTVTDINGCSGTSTMVSTQLYVAPSPNITGNLFLCSGNSTVLDAGSGYLVYSWSSGENTQSILADSSDTYTVTVTDIHGCTGTNSVVTQFANSPTPIIIGNLSFCQGSSTTLTASAGYVQYIWSTLATTNSIVVNTSNTFTVTVTALNGCTGSTSVTTQSVAAPTPVISGDLNICPNSSSILDAGIGYQSYQWSTGATSHSIFINTGGVYSVSVVDNNGCSGSSSVSVVVVNNSPGAVGPISGIASGLCNTNGMVFSVAPVANATFYQWTVPSQGVITNGQGTPSISVDFGAFGNGFISLVALNSCGQSPVTTLPISSLPNVPGPISGQATGLCGQSAMVYSIAPVPGTTFYNWIVPYGASIVSGQGSTSITVDYIGFATGNISVEALNDCGRSGASILPIIAAPAAPLAISGPTSQICNQPNVLYSVPPVFGAVTYSWTVPSGCYILSGQGSNQIRVKFNNKIKTGNICVFAKNACGSGVATCLTVTGLPDVPGIISGPSGVCAKQANVIYSVVPVPGATSYIWTVPKKATIKSGKGTPTISVTFSTYSGYISVAAKNDCGTSAIVSIPVNIICREKEESELTMSDINVYPNPANSFINIHFYSPESAKYALQLFDVVGQAVIHTEVNTVEGENDSELDLSLLAKGIYFLSLSNENARYKTIRIVVE